jgi:hypothetical protein
VKRIVLLVAALAVAASFVGASSAGAYGGKAAYQVGFSFNCDNKTSPLCTTPPPQGFGIGGEWGWYAFDSDNTFDAQVTFCSHSQGTNGAFHQDEDGIWKTGPATAPFFGQTIDDFYVSTDGGKNWQDTLIPAAAGHYSAKLAPGVSAEAQVAG